MESDTMTRSAKRQHHPKQPVLDRVNPVNSSKTITVPMSSDSSATSQERQNLLRRDVFPVNILLESLIHRKNILHLTAQGIPDILLA